MKNTILLFLIVFLGNDLYLFSQENEFINFEHKALSLNIKYPTTWKKYWFYDDYSDKNYFDLSRNEINKMIIKYGYYPIFYIKKYDEIYNGINPSIRITLLPHYYYYNLISIRDLIMALYNEEYESKFYLFGEMIDREIDIVKLILSREREITQDINVQYIRNKSVLHFKTEDYVLDSNIPDDNFKRITDYYLCIEDEYIMVIEVNYSKTININDKNELMEIIKNIRLR
jgi:hypothetical protein